ncbi:MAG: site-specific DNA-methyltransferase [Clostridiales Family XIII bacterium]|jgi:adenine-specific DNA-methyltransferase|nr:site-specific DNA-methyltransferase [Clostridiales Family XIII bacterium]
MAAINDLLRQIADPMLRERLSAEVDRLGKNKKFGLVFEEHVPECTPLYGIPVRRGSAVARKTEKMNGIYRVKKLDGKNAVCVGKASGETATIPLTELVPVAQFGEPVFPSLEPIAKVANAPGDSLWHTLIEADNYHALQLLEYLYEGQVDCIYIDPPYNTGARDWKYNNDYVDSSDAWRHSKWLSMMQKRLKLAKKILNPDTGVLIVTIDEHEVHHLRTLLDELFPESFIQMTTDVINPKGNPQGHFARVEEYNIFCFMPNTPVTLGNDPLLGDKPSTKNVRWYSLLGSGTDSQRKDRKDMFYPIYIDTKRHRVVKAGTPLPFDEHPTIGEKIDEYDVAWPIRDDMSEGRWYVAPATLNSLISEGYVELGSYDKRRQTWSMRYLGSKHKRQMASGELVITEFDEERNCVCLAYKDSLMVQMKTVWHRSLHDAGAYGSDFVSSIVGQSRAFSFPKSLYSTRDSVAAVVKNIPDALVVDFFAGSGTTLHAVNLLNAEDDGKRRCILVTNNEVSEAETRSLKSAGCQPGDPEWETHGICRQVTWPRTEYSILGKRKDGTALSGEYCTSQTYTRDVNRSFYQLGFVENPAALVPAAKKQIVALIGKDKLPQSLVKTDSRFIVSEKHPASVLFDTEAVGEWLAALEEQGHITDFYIVAKDNRVFNGIKAKVATLLGTVTVTEPLKRPMSEGFPANVEYFKLGFLDKNSVSLGRQFAEILPLLWLKAGAVGERPGLDGEKLPDMLILPQNAFAVLLDEDRYGEFAEQLTDMDNIRTVYFVTNSEEAFREMSDGVGQERTCQLYRDYIDNFVIGSRRNKL